MFKWADFIKNKTDKSYPASREYFDSYYDIFSCSNPVSFSRIIHHRITLLHALLVLLLVFAG